jgi:hypothetical protein
MGTYHQPPDQTNYNIEPFNEKATTNTTPAGMIGTMGSPHHCRRDCGEVRLPTRNVLISMPKWLMSFGFHYYETTNMSLTLPYFERPPSLWAWGNAAQHCRGVEDCRGGLYLF